MRKKGEGIHCSNGEEGEENEREGISEAGIAVRGLSTAAEVEACRNQANTEDDEPDCSDDKERSSSVCHRLHSQFKELFRLINK